MGGAAFRITHCEAEGRVCDMQYAEAGTQMGVIRGGISGVLGSILCTLHKKQRASMPSSNRARPWLWILEQHDHAPQGRWQP